MRKTRVPCISCPKVARRSLGSQALASNEPSKSITTTPRACNKAALIRLRYQPERPRILSERANRPGKFTSTIAPRPRSTARPSPRSMKARIIDQIMWSDMWAQLLHCY
eukprot:3452423-Pyramimonas_sp.AAC.1